MAKVFIQESTLTSIGDAIRAKTGKTALIDPANMSAEIASITTGGGSGDDGELIHRLTHLTGNCRAKFAYGGWNWILDEYGSQIASENVTDASQMFTNNEGFIAPDFDLNMSDWRAAVRLNAFANYAYYITKVPSIKFTVPETPPPGETCSANMDFAFAYCSRLNDMDNLYSAEALEYLTKLPLVDPWSWYTQQLFVSCSSLRRLPAWYYNLHPNWETSSALPDSYNIPYFFGGCCSLDEILNIPVWRAETPGEYMHTVTSDAFFSGSSLNECYRLARFTFETKDGTPITAKWAGQTLGFSRNAGWANWWDLSSLNNNITKAHQVTDDASYQALKNDPNWWTYDVAYSRYNHTSAVETINSLPDTSAFVAEYGTPNTIIFKAEAGSKTDGGACGNLTEEEIAVAAAKGWTVTFE